MSRIVRITIVKDWLVDDLIGGDYDGLIREVEANPRAFFDGAEWTFTEQLANWDYAKHTVKP